MTAIVRLFSHAGLIGAPVSPAGGRLSTDDVFLLRQPYLNNEQLSVSSSSVSSAAATAPEKTKLLRVQVQEGKTVNYEVTPANIVESDGATDATQASPVLVGDQIFEFGEGWVISFIENTDA